MPICDAIRMGNSTGRTLQVSHIRRAVPAALFSVWLVTAGCGGSHGDQSLTTSIQAKLYSDPTTKGSDVGVAVHNGVVTLSGNVTDPNVALEAMKIANGTPGVKSVQDKLTVNGAPAEPASEAAASAPAQAPEQRPHRRDKRRAEADNVPPPPPAAPQPVEVTIAARTPVQVRLIDGVDSAHDQVGQTFRATLYEPLVSDGRVVIPAGAPATIVLANAKKAGRIKGKAELELSLSSIQYQGKEYRVESTTYEAQSKSRGKQTAVRTGIGAAAGAVIGAIAGGGKGAAIGSAAGGGTGFGVNMFLHGPQVKIPSETVLTFRLEQPLTVTE